MSEELLSRFKSCKVSDSQESASILDSIALDLGKSEAFRIQFGSLDIWKDLRRLWRDLVRAQLTFWDGDDDEPDKENDRQRFIKSMCSALSRFTRNLVAGVPDNQEKAFENEPDIRRLLHYYTSWTASQDQDAVLTARILAQTLSNIVTGNSTLISKLWEAYLGLPEDQAVLIRLLAASDHRTLLTALVLMRNCLHGSKTRTKKLVKTAIGTRICVSLLDNMVKLYDAKEGSDGAKAFDVGYEIFTFIMDGGFVPVLYNKFSIPDEIVTPHQTTLLKLVDSYLQSTTAVDDKNDQATKMIYDKLNPMLAGCFFTLSSYVQHSVRRALGNNVTAYENGFSSPSSILDASESHSLSELDTMIPKACEALVLVAQCMITVTLEDGNSKTSVSGLSHKEYFNDLRVDNRGLAETLIELLRLLDAFLPRINFGQPMKDPGKPALQQAGSSGFNYLKRDLVRLLGILCHDSKAVQDRIRVCGGIEVVMNLCVVDESNPYLREHAIFTLRNILHGNSENQAVVEEIKPERLWDENGVLREAARA